MSDLKNISVSGNFALSCYWPFIVEVFHLFELYLGQEYWSFSVPNIEKALQTKNTSFSTRPRPTQYLCQSLVYTDFFYYFNIFSPDDYYTQQN